MARMHGEMEFEFREDDEGEGEFLACGKVVQFLKNHIAKGHLDEAASLLASCAENVGDELIQDITTGGASKQILGALAEMFFKARDFARAAQCAEAAGRPDIAAKFLEANYDLEQAAEHYLQAGNLAKAAELFERNLTFDRAAELFLKMKDYPRAAENLERAGNYFYAGQLYLKMSRWDKAVEVLQRIDSMGQHFIPSTRLLGQVLEKTGNTQMAQQRYLEVVRNRPIDGETLEIHYRLARLLADQGHHSQARQLLDGVLGLKPDHEGAQQVVALLGADGASAAAQASQPAAGGASQALDLGETADVSAGQDRLVGVDRDFEFLRQVPLFHELALDELKYVQSVCEKSSYAAGARLITQGQPGEALFVLAQGKVAVTAPGPDGSQTEVAELGPGVHVGEMALLDDSPTSANVVAKEKVVAYKLPRKRFEELLQANERIQVRIYRVLIGTLTQRLREANEKAAAGGGAAGADSKPCPFCAETIKAAARKCKHCGEFLDKAE